MWQRLMLLPLQPPLRPCPAGLVRTLSHVAATPSFALAPSPAPPLHNTAGHPSAASALPPCLLRRHTRPFSASPSSPVASAASTSPPASSPSSASISSPSGHCAAHLSPSSATAAGPDAATASDAVDSGDAGLSGSEWSEVESRLMEMAASKSRASVSGVRRNEFELMPVFMQRVGLTPERLASLNFIHVAGTKGKGSTCAMVESILRACGYRTALYTSPHLVDVRERIRVDGKMLPRSEFAAAFHRVYGALRAAADRDSEGGPGMPSFFYFITLMAMDALLSRPSPLPRPHVVVLEVGIGGRLDATSAVVTRGSLAAAAITLLGFDHMELLGDTLPKIAREKAGIMRSGRPVFVAPQEQDAMEALEEVSSRVGAHLLTPPALDTYHLASGSVGLGLGGEHMRTNAAVAVALAAEWEAQYGAAAAAAAAAAVAAGASESAAAVAAAVEAAAGRPVALAPGGPDPAAAAARAAAVRSLTLPAEYAEGLRTVHWPGRSQVVRDDVAASRGAGGGDGGQLVWYLDGAHTPESMAVCAAWFAGELAAAEEERTAAAEAGAGAEGTQSVKPVVAPSHRRRRHAAVLLFNCMRERDPGVLLPALATAMQQNQLQQQHLALPAQQQGPEAAAATALFGGFDAAIFTPMLSGGGVLLPAHPGAADRQAGGAGAGAAAPQQQQQPPQSQGAAAAAVDLSWQTRMREVWDSVRAGEASGGKEGANVDGASSPAAPATAGVAAGLRATAAAAADGGIGIGGDGGRLPGLPRAAVAESLPGALEALRAAAAADPGVTLHVLVTGSLYLVGDVLRLLNKPPV